MQRVRSIATSLILLILLSAFTPVVDDLIELQAVFNGRSSANFLRSAGNVRLRLSRGTVGKIKDIKRFSSGNSGLLIEVKNGSYQGELVWVHYNPRKELIALCKSAETGEVDFSEDCNETRELSEASSARTNADVDALPAPRAESLEGAPVYTPTLLPSQRAAKLAPLADPTESLTSADQLEIRRSLEGIEGVMSRLVRNPCVVTGLASSNMSCDEKYAWLFTQRVRQQPNGSFMLDIDNLREEVECRSSNSCIMGNMLRVIASEFGIPARLMMATAYRESRWNHWNKGGRVITNVNRGRVKSTDWGFMQINDYAHKRAAPFLVAGYRVDWDEVTHDPLSNMRVGAKILKACFDVARDHMRKNGMNLYDEELLFRVSYTCYNGGPSSSSMSSRVRAYDTRKMHANDKKFIEELRKADWDKNASEACRSLKVGGKTRRLSW